MKYEPRFRWGLPHEWGWPQEVDQALEKLQRHLGDLALDEDDRIASLSAMERLITALRTTKVTYHSLLERFTYHERASHRRQEDHDKAMRIALSCRAEALSKASFDPHGSFVYLLRDKQHTVLYVGLSTNILGRLGDHLRDTEKRRRVATVQLLRCKNRQDMERTERRLIAHYQPPLNIVGIENREPGSGMRDGVIRRGSTYSYVVRERDGLTGKSKPRWVGGFKTAADARRSRDAARVQTAHGEGIVDSRITGM